MASDGRLIESHPELCFTGLRGDSLQYTKNSALGFGERLQALEQITEPQLGANDSAPELVRGMVNALDDDATEVGVDDILDAIALVACQDDLNVLDGCSPGCDGHGNESPMKMVYWSANPLEKAN